MSALPWLMFVGGVVVRLGVLGAAVTVVRRGEPRSGYLLAAAAGVSILFLCCLRGMSLYMTSEQFELDRRPMEYGIGCVDALQPLFVRGLMVAAIVMLARAAKPATPLSSR